MAYAIKPRGQIFIEEKASVKSSLGRSPDVGEAILLALGEAIHAGLLLVRVPGTRHEESVV